jgi:hypothetical protein
MLQGKRSAANPNYGLMSWANDDHLVPCSEIENFQSPEAKRYSFRARKRHDAVYTEVSLTSHTVNSSGWDFACTQRIVSSWMLKQETT